MNSISCQTAKLTFIDENSAQIFKKKEHVLIGISPNNSYYTEKKIEQILVWVLEQGFKDFHVFLADEISFYNWLTKGKIEKEAKKRTREEDNKQRNRLFRVCEKYNLSKDILVRYEDIKTQEIYQYWYQFYRNLFQKNEVLLNQVYHLIFSESENKNHFSLEYFFAELPMILNVADILKIPFSCAVYHRIEGIPEYLFKQQKLHQENQGFIKLIFEN